MSSLGLSRHELRLICQTNATAQSQARGRLVAGALTVWRCVVSSGSRRLVRAPEPVREPPVHRAYRPSRRMLRRARRGRADRDARGGRPEHGPRRPRSTGSRDHTEPRRSPSASRLPPRACAATPPPSGPRSSSTSRCRSSPSPRARGEAACRRPPLSLLRAPAAAKPGATPSRRPSCAARRGCSASVLADFGVKGEIKDMHPGPVVTLFEFEPARGIKSARVIGLADDIARSMGAACVRAAVDAGPQCHRHRAAQRAAREGATCASCSRSDAFRTTDATLPLVLGKNIAGTPVFADLARMPHLLVAGTTGSGKSVGVNAMILSLLYRLSPEQCRFLMIDPKMLELSVYNGIPHLLCPVVTEPDKAVAALNWVVAEMEERYRRMALQAVRNIDAFNTRVRHDAAARRAGLCRRAGRGPRADALHRRRGRRVRRPDDRRRQGDRGGRAAAGADGARGRHPPDHGDAAALRRHHHRHHQGQLPDPHQLQGRLQVRQPHHPQRAGRRAAAGPGRHAVLGRRGPHLRVHGPFVSDEEVERIAAYLREQGEPRYIDGITDVADRTRKSTPAPARARPQQNDLYERAVAIVLRDQQGLHQLPAAPARRRLQPRRRPDRAHGAGGRRQRRPASAGGARSSSRLDAARAANSGRQGITGRAGRWCGVEPANRPQSCPNVGTNDG